MLEKLQLKSRVNAEWSGLTWQLKKPLGHSGFFMG
jgi:hypothetical protein